MPSHSQRHVECHKTAATHVPPADAHGILVTFLREYWDEIAAEWVQLLTSDGLPYLIERDPVAIRASFELTAHLIVEQFERGPSSSTARNALLARYEGFGRDWAERGPTEAALAVEPPQITRAIGRVMVRHYDMPSHLRDVVSCFAVLNSLAMDLALARMLGYIDYNEQLSHGEQEAVVSLIAQLTRRSTNRRELEVQRLLGTLSGELSLLQETFQVARQSSLTDSTVDAHLQPMGETIADAISTLGAIMDLSDPTVDDYLELPGGDASGTSGQLQATDSLTPREADVLALIATGATTREIATALVLSEHTVKRHTSNIYQKLHVRHRSEAAVAALRHGLVFAQALNS